MVTLVATCNTSLISNNRTGKIAMHYNFILKHNLPDIRHLHLIVYTQKSPTVLNTTEMIQNSKTKVQFHFQSLKMSLSPTVSYA